MREGGGRRVEAQVAHRDLIGTKPDDHGKREEEKRYISDVHGDLQLQQRKAERERTRGEEFGVGLVLSAYLYESSLPSSSRFSSPSAQKPSPDFGLPSPLAGPSDPPSSDEAGLSG